MVRRVDIDDEIHKTAEILCPKYLSVTGFLNLILDKALQDEVVMRRLPTCRAGAGTTGQVIRQQPPQQPSLPTEEVQDLLAVTAVESSAQKIEPPQTHKGTNSKKPRAKRTKGSPEFETFWGAYQAIEHRANKQAKPQAWEVWKQLMDDGVTASDLMTAISKAQQDVQRRLQSNEFASPLPDCFRWLRDECYAVYLEDHKPNTTPSYRW